MTDATLNGHGELSKAILAAMSKGPATCREEGHSFGAWRLTQYEDRVRLTRRCLNCSHVQFREVED